MEEDEKERFRAYADAIRELVGPVFELEMKIREGGDDRILHKSMSTLREAYKLLLTGVEDIWDVCPELVSVEAFSPEREHEAISLRFDLLAQKCGPSRHSLIQELSNSAPEHVATSLEAAGSDAERVAILMKWWHQEPKPYRPIARFVRQLADEHLWRRLYAARALETCGAPPLIDPLTNDVNESALHAWLSSRENPDDPERE
jgi:hypothetical protein